MMVNGGDDEDGGMLGVESVEERWFYFIDESEEGRGEGNACWRGKKSK